MIDTLPATFRAACHWAIRVRVLVGPEGLSDVEIPKGATPEARLAAGRDRAAVARLRSYLFPEDQGDV